MLFFNHAKTSSLATIKLSIKTQIKVFFFFNPHFPPLLRPFSSLRSGPRSSSSCGGLPPRTRATGRGGGIRWDRAASWPPCWGRLRAPCGTWCARSWTSTASRCARWGTGRTFPAALSVYLNVKLSVFSRNYWYRVVRA